MLRIILRKLAFECPARKGGVLYLSALSICVVFQATLAEPAEELLSKLQDSRAEVRLATLGSKAMIGCYVNVDEQSCHLTTEQFRKVNEVLDVLTSDLNEEIRAYAARYLSGSTDARAVKPLGRLLRDPSAKVRAIVAGSFWTMLAEDKAIVQRLEELLEDPDPRVRQYAAGALVMNGTPDSLTHLKNAGKSEADQKTREVMADVIRQLDSKSPRWRSERQER